MRYRYAAIGLSCGLAASASAASLDVTLTIPRIDVAEYHRPYVAAWIEREDRSVAANLAVWYQQKPAKDAQSGKMESGAKWLADLRQWWRRSGRDQALPIDGVSGATRPAGEQRLHFEQGKPPLGALPAGSYKLVVEAAREVGGREVLTIPFEWPPRSPQHLDAQGKTELGALRLDLDPS
ncbi:MAG: DUF2271 domain-containing protein [Lysobacteraceae bacterium]|nr:MAG: DUF2271 domain-containing protein [Xanthomonadaceae bacterium]